jgi:D-lactate dehydrogenase
MDLLAPDVRRIGHPAGEPAEDRVPDELAGGTPEPLRSQLIAEFGADRVLARVSDLVRYASDASPYRLIPQAVIEAHDAADVAKAFAFGRRSGIPVTLRSAGTSLNGQGQGAGLLVDVRKHFRGVRAEDDGLHARVQPGTVLGHANRVLRRHRRRLGPDPASTDAATVGGVIANNSGGMRCGTWADSYSTVRAMKLVLPSGTVVDTAAPDAEERFARDEPELAAGLLAIRDELRGDTELAERVRRKFEIKNTMGYRLCAFLDADTPVEIFRRLVVGSEGTLAFIAEAVFETVAVPARTTISWLHFADVETASEPVEAFVAAGATAVELMGAPALMVAANSIAGTDKTWLELPFESAALLVEFGGDDDAALDEQTARATEILSGIELLRPPAFTRDVEAVEVAWQVREGMFGLVGKLRPAETSLIIEDVCVPPARIAEGVRDVQALLGKHGFLPGTAGHASAGNLHFMLTPVMGDPADRVRYDAFITDLIELIVDKYDGSLKAEHGTGRNMAPFVEKEWGAKATGLMWRIKELCDPDGVLNPGVILNRDPGVHLQDLQSTPAIEEEATSCVECGFCEPVCPSRWLTTTPRQRIVLRREMARQPEGSPVAAALLEEYEYDSLETCAADGSCKLVCPVGIDTGKLVKGYRAAQHTERAAKAAERVASRWGAVERVGRTGLKARGPARAASKAARALLADELIPELPGNAPGPAPPLPATEREGATAVYLPACINRIFGPPAHVSGSLPEALVRVSARAGAPVWIPDDVAGHCCSVPFGSKGFTGAEAQMGERTVEALWRWTGGGVLPVVMDANSCTHGLREQAAERRPDLQVLDAIEWVQRLLPSLDVRRRVASVAVHPTCSARHMGLVHRLQEVMEAMADEVVVPAAATCCGFAGDRGMLHPELTAAATADEAAELAQRPFDAHVCGNRTCEIGLEQATGAPYASFVHLLDQLTA